jgi:hypothetical protein
MAVLIAFVATAIVIVLHPAPLTTLRREGGRRKEREEEPEGESSQKWHA